MPLLACDVRGNPYMSLDMNLIKKEIGDINCQEGGNNTGKLWKLNQKILPRVNSPPTAMKNEKGDILTSKGAIEKEALRVIKSRLENRKIKTSLSNHKDDREKL